MPTARSKPVLMYMGAQDRDPLGRILHEFRAEVCGRVAAVMVPVPEAVKVDDNVRAEMKRAAAASFAALEQREMARIRLGL